MIGTGICHSFRIPVQKYESVVKHFLVLSVLHHPLEEGNSFFLFEERKADWTANCIGSPCFSS